MRYVERLLSGAMMLLAVTVVCMPREAPSQEAAQEISPREAIARALESKTDFQFVEVPLSEVVQYLRQRHGINIVLDRLALADAGIGVDAPITISLSGLSLRSALRLQLDTLQLTYDIGDEVLLITTPEEQENRLETVVYDVSDVVRGRNEIDVVAHDVDSLIDIILTCIAAESWSDVGGPGNIRELHGHSLVVSQTDDVHEQVAKLLATMRTIRDERAADQELETYYPLMHVGSNEAAIRQALGQPADLKFTDAPLSEVMQFVSSAYGIQVVPHILALDDAGTGSDVPVTAHLSGLSLRSALRLLLRDLQLTFVVQNEVLLITTPEEQENMLEVGIYPVGDLLRAPDVGPGARADYDSLVDLMVECVAPESWEHVGGPGSVREVSTLESIIVAQTADVHAETAKLLADLRNSRHAAADEPDVAEPVDTDELSLKFYRLVPTDNDDNGADVIRLIMSVVEPESWRQRGGDTMVMYVRGSLAIRHHAKAHRQIHKLLRDLDTPEGKNAGGVLYGNCLSGGFGGGSAVGGGFFDVPKDR